jgi:hypothetical protein
LNFTLLFLSRFSEFKNSLKVIKCMRKPAETIRGIV